MTKHRTQEPLTRAPEIDLRTMSDTSAGGTPSAEDKKRGQSGHSWKKK
jgi:hypothetical protein